jgi:hypothetical protein
MVTFGSTFGIFGGDNYLIRYKLNRKIAKINYITIILILLYKFHVDLSAFHVELNKEYLLLRKKN